MNDPQLKDKAEKFFLQGKWAKALEAFLRLSEQTPQDFRVRLKIADTLLRLERQEEAQIIFRQVADLYTRDGQLHKAIAVHQRLLELDREDREAQAKMALLYDKQKATTPAIGVMGKDEIDQTVETICQDEVMEQIRDFRERLRQAFKRSDFPTALEFALKLWRLEPSQVDTRLAIARALQALKRNREASEVYFHAGNQLLMEAQVLRAIFVQGHIDEQHLPKKRAELEKKISIVLGKAGDQRAKRQPDSLWNRIPILRQRKEIMENILDEVLIDPIDLGKVKPLPVLSLLPRKECETLLRVLKPQTFAKGEVIFPMHASADSFYWIVHGEVGLIQQTATNLSPQSLPGSLLTETELLGIFGFLYDGKRRQSAIAQSEVELLELSRKDYDQLVQSNEVIREAFDLVYRQEVLYPRLSLQPLFASWVPEDLRKLSELFTTERHANHSFKLLEGSSVEKCMYIREGKIDQFWGKLFDQEPLLSHVSGQLLSDLEWASGGISPFSYRASGSVTLLTLKLSELKGEQRQNLQQPNHLKMLLQQRGDPPTKLDTSHFEAIAQKLKLS